MCECIRSGTASGSGYVKPLLPHVGHHFAIVTPSLAGQGAERKALHIGNGLLERGHQIDILLERLVCHYAEEVPDRSRVYFMSERSDDRSRTNLRSAKFTARRLVPVPASWRVRFPRMGMATRLLRSQLPLLISSRLPRWSAGIAAYMDREQPETILAMNVLAATATTMALRLSRHPVRVVATLHEGLGRGRLLRRARCSYPHADAVVGVSRGVSGEFDKIPGLKSGRVHVIYNPVISEFLIRKSTESVGHPWFEGRGDPVIVTIGKLIRRKDFSSLLVAFSRLVTRRRVRLVLLGEGRERNRLESLVRRLGIAEYVKFTGFVENPYAYLRRADLFVLSSRNEALPTVLIEAMACGCPVVSTDCPFGPREILEDGKFGTLVPVGDPAALSDAMDRALNEPRRSDALRERAAFFGADRAVDQYEKLLLGEEGFGDVVGQ